MYGPNWARASSVAFRGAKGTGFEGGVHVPAFARHPDLAAKGERNDQFGTVMDIMPTLLNLAGTKHPGEVYQGRAVLAPKGRSLIATLRDPETAPHDASLSVGWELHGHRALRQGDWKLVWDPSEENSHWLLFNLADDQQEQRDLSAVEPERLRAMIALWNDYHEENGLRP
jgi:arylsulfatase